jgi:hypothetical protein
VSSIFATFDLSLALWSSGYGQNLPVLISQLGATSRGNNGIAFSYAPPSISDVALTTSQGSRRRLALLDGVPTLGANLTLTGRCFSSDVFLPAFVSLDSAALIPAIVHEDTRIVFTLPPGDGSMHTLAVVIGDRTSNATFFSYTGECCCI